MGQPTRPLFDRRGIVLLRQDLTYERWPQMAKEAGLNLIALHVLGGPPSELVEFAATDAGERFLQQVADVGLGLEYELHALMELLPRELHERNPEMFRADESGDRVADANLCVSSPEALEVIGEQAVLLAQKLTPTTHRYFLWADDGKPWCHCSGCRGLSPADQNLTAMNALVNALRGFDPGATLAALAYHDTLTPPTQVAPDEGLFLEYAPIRRSWDVPLNDRNDGANAEHVEGLRRLLDFFSAEGSQVLEYWMDASRHSSWQRPARKLPVTPEVMAADAEFYASLGFQHATSFGCFLDAEYFRMHGKPPIEEYGRALRGRRG